MPIELTHLTTHSLSPKSLNVNLSLSGFNVTCFIVNLRGSEVGTTETFGFLENMVNAASSSSILASLNVQTIIRLLGSLGTRMGMPNSSFSTEMDSEENAKGKLKQYKKQKLIGTGGGGEVYLCVVNLSFFHFQLDQIHNREVVVKSGLVGSSLNGVGMENLRELKFFTELGIADHPNFIKV